MDCYLLARIICSRHLNQQALSKSIFSLFPPSVYLYICGTLCPFLSKDIVVDGFIMFGVYMQFCQTNYCGEINYI